MLSVKTQKTGAMPFSMRIVQVATLFGACPAEVAKSPAFDEVSSRRRHEYACSLSNEVLDEPIACGDARKFRLRVLMPRAGHTPHVSGALSALTRRRQCDLGVAMFRSRTRDGTGYAMASVKLNPTSRLESRAGSRSTGESHENG